MIVHRVADLPEGLARELPADAGPRASQGPRARGEPLSTPRMVRGLAVQRLRGM